jgi:hypothetical protein
MIEDIEMIKRRQMTFRKVLLRVVFGALGLAACFGAAGVVFVGHDTLWRIVGTCAATAGGAFVILGASHLLDVQATWMPGLMAIALTVVEYLATLGLTWSLFGSADAPAGITMLCLAATAIPAIVFSSVMKRPEAALLARVGLFASSVVFMLFMIGTWGGWLAGFREERWYNLGLMLAVFAVLAVLCLVGAGIDHRHWRWLGVAAAGTAFLISAYAIIFDIHRTSAFFVCVVSVAVVVAHANVMARCPLKPNQRWLLWGTIGAGITTGAFVDWASITSPWQEEMLERLAGAAAIIGGCGTLALMVLARVNQRIVPASATVADLREITLVCPRCQAKQTIAIGLGKCKACGLIIEVRVQVREPEG